MIFIILLELICMRKKWKTILLSLFVLCICIIIISCAFKKLDVSDFPVIDTKEDTSVEKYDER